MSSLHFGHGSLNDDSDAKKKNAIKYITIGCLLGVMSYMMSSSRDSGSKSTFSKPIQEDFTSSLWGSSNTCQKGI